MKEDFKVYSVLFVICASLIAAIYFLVNELFLKPQYKTYEDCMISKMHSRPSSMHEIISVHCQKETKDYQPIVQYHDMDTTKEEDR